MPRCHSAGTAVVIVRSYREIGGLFLASAKRKSCNGERVSNSWYLTNEDQDTTYSSKEYCIGYFDAALAGSDIQIRQSTRPSPTGMSRNTPGGSREGRCHDHHRSADETKDFETLNVVGRRGRRWTKDWRTNDCLPFIFQGRTTYCRSW